MTTDADARKLVVSLHDVSPFTREVFAAMLDELAAWGVARCSLLVIPNYHHRGSMVDDAGFCRWLEAQARRGHEIVAHGYYHQRAARAGEGWCERLVTRVYTKGEGEFYDLSRAEAAGRLARAQADFAQLDAPAPTGFIAPAWLLGAEAAGAVRAAGFRYTTTLTGVRDFAAEARGVQGFIAARSLVYSPRSRWRRACSLGYNVGLAWALGNAPLLRLALHPPDYRFKQIWRQVERIVRGTRQGREAVTYGEAVGRG